MFRYVKTAIIAAVMLAPTIAEARPSSFSSFRSSPSYSRPSYTPSYSAPRVYSAPPVYRAPVVVRPVYRAPVVVARPPVVVVHHNYYHPYYHPVVPVIVPVNTGPVVASQVGPYVPGQPRVVRVCWWSLWHWGTVCRREVRYY